MGRGLPFLIAIAAMALARAALAADPPSAAAAPVSTAPSDATPAQIDSWLADKGGEPSGDAAPVSTASDASAPRSIHGEASVGFGSNGYREAKVGAAIPVGQTGTLDVAVGDERFRGYDRRDLAVGLAIGTGASLEPCGLFHTGVQLASDAVRRTRCGQPAEASAP